MLRLFRSFEGSSLRTADNVKGRFQEFVLDIQSWSVRYFAVQFRNGFRGRQYLISPSFSGKVNESEIEIHLQSSQLAGAPKLAEKTDVFPNNLRDDYYHWPSQWRGAGIWGAAPNREGLFGAEDRDAPSDIILESSFAITPSPVSTHVFLEAKDLLGFTVDAIDHSVGVLLEALVDTDYWTVPFLIVSFQGPSKRCVLLPTEWVRDTHWKDEKIETGLLQNAFLNAPSFQRFDQITPELIEETLRYSSQFKWRRPARSA